MKLRIGLRNLQWALVCKSDTPFSLIPDRREPGIKDPCIQAELYAHPKELCKRRLS